jgi:hypothetical protein
MDAEEKKMFGRYLAKHFCEDVGQADSRPCKF